MSVFSEDNIKEITKGILEQLSAETRATVQTEVNQAAFRLWEKHHAPVPLPLPDKLIRLPLPISQCVIAVTEVHQPFCDGRVDCYCT